MFVTIIGRENGVGLSKDKALLTAILQENNFTVEFRSISWFKPLHPDCDICIHTEVVDLRYFGKKNILIPNQEWFYKKWLIHLKKFDAIFCKTKYATDIFNKYHDNALHIGFTSVDHYKNGTKNLECFHSQGKSKAKGTRFLIEAWKNDSLPKLNLVSRGKQKVKYGDIKVYNRFLPEEKFKSIMNECLIHIYPCQVEGFGHCINESKSCGAVVVTTDYAPMNEHVSNFVIPVYKKKYFSSFLGESVIVRPSDISKIVKNLLNRNDLHEIGQKNRESFLANDQVFRQKFILALNQVLKS